MLVAKKKCFLTKLSRTSLVPLYLCVLRCAELRTALHNATAIFSIHSLALYDAQPFANIMTDYFGQLGEVAIAAAKHTLVGTSAAIVGQIMSPFFQVSEISQQFGGPYRVFYSILSLIFPPC